jgi:hypothetical protein
MQYLIRRISNFDLAPISFFQSVGHILLASRQSFRSNILAEIPDHRLMIGIAFLVGFHPTLGVNHLVARSSLGCGSGASAPKAASCKKNSRWT